ncbi:MAG: class I SAM-dependent methyltransferase [Vicinamibacterales bacterium]
MDALESRQLADLSFPEVARALRALSSAYVERRSKLQQGAALDGAGKRAAFALFYGPLHYLLVHHIVTSLGSPFADVDALIELGCGTAASGAGWTAACGRAPRYVGVDRHPWAIAEAKQTCAAFGLQATLRVGDFTRMPLPFVGEPKGRAKGAGRSATPSTGLARTGVLLAFAVNEIASASDREALLAELLACGRRGACVLVVEPLARGAAPWWPEWQRAFQQAGGRSDEWRVAAALPPIVEKLDRAAGLRHLLLTGRTLALNLTN